MANIDSKITVGKDVEPCSGVLKAFSILLQTYILNLLLNKERDSLHIISYLISKTK